MWKSSSEEAESYYPVRPECEVPKTQFRIKNRKRTLSERAWRAAFTEDGCVHIGDTLGRIQRWGIHPSIRGEVWEFLLGCFDPCSTYEERNQIRQRRREQYAAWKEECRKMNSVIGSGRIITAPIITEDGDPIQDPIVLMEASVDKHLSSSQGDSVVESENDINGEEQTSTAGDDLRAEGSSSELDKSDDLRAEGGSSELDKSDDLSAEGGSSEFDKPDDLRAQGGSSELDKSDALRAEGSSSELDNPDDFIEEGGSSELDKPGDLRAEDDSSALDKLGDLRAEGCSSALDKLGDLRAEGCSSELDMSDSTEKCPMDNKEIQWKLNLHQIGLDVVRTDRTLVFYEKQDNLSKLWDILAVYAWIDKDVGYCQGMSDLCSPMIILLDDEADAFWCFERLMCRLRRNFRCTESSVGVEQQLNSLASITQIVDPKLHQHLETLGGGDYLFAFRMLMVLFRREFSFGDSLFLWEMMWALEYDPNLFSVYEEPELEHEKNEGSKGKARQRKEFGKFERENIRNGAKNLEPTPISVFLVASILKGNSAKLLQEARGLDDVVKILNDLTGNLDARKACSTAIKLHKSYLKKAKKNQDIEASTQSL